MMIILAAYTHASAAAAAAAAPPPSAASLPQLFMDIGSDIIDPWGLLESKPTALVANQSMGRPPANYTQGATVIAAFSVLGVPGEYEVFVAEGRPGEPLSLLPEQQLRAQQAMMMPRPHAMMETVNDSNAVATGPHVTSASATSCQSICAANSSCLQWTWNMRSHHCFHSSSTEWTPSFSDHCVSGCRSDQVTSCGSAPKPPPSPAPPGGVAVQRFTTRDFVRYSPPTTVLYLPNNSPGSDDERVGVHVADGGIWTVKSMDRNQHSYLLLAYYGDTCSAFAAPLSLGPHSFQSTLGESEQMSVFVCAEPRSIRHD
jgi:hypothetical protein